MHRNNQPDENTETFIVKMKMRRFFYFSFFQKENIFRSPKYLVDCTYLSSAKSCTIAARGKMNPRFARSDKENTSSILIIDKEIVLFIRIAEDKTIRRDFRR
jgi:hypothetical protein